jgi:hypothetical protein
VALLPPRDEICQLMERICGWLGQGELLARARARDSELST